MLAQRPHILGHQPGEDAVKLAVFTGPNVPHTAGEASEGI